MAHCFRHTQIKRIDYKYIIIMIIIIIIDYWLLLIIIINIIIIIYICYTMHFFMISQVNISRSSE
jgi:hypothetical protein